MAALHTQQHGDVPPGHGPPHFVRVGRELGDGLRVHQRLYRVDQRERPPERRPRPVPRVDPDREERSREAAVLHPREVDVAVRQPRRDVGFHVERTLCRAARTNSRCAAYDEPGSRGTPDRPAPRTLRSRRCGPPRGGPAPGSRGRGPKAYARPRTWVARRTPPGAPHPSRAAGESAFHLRPERLALAFRLGGGRFRGGGRGRRGRARRRGRRPECGRLLVTTTLFRRRALGRLLPRAAAPVASTAAPTTPASAGRSPHPGPARPRAREPARPAPPPATSRHTRRPPPARDG